MNRRITGHHLFVISFSLSLFLFFFSLSLFLFFSFSSLLFACFTLRYERHPSTRFVSLHYRAYYHDIRSGRPLFAFLIGSGGWKLRVVPAPLQRWRWRRPARSQRQQQLSARRLHQVSFKSNLIGCRLTLGFSYQVSEWIDKEREGDK